MDVDKFCAEVHRQLCEMDEGKVVEAGVLQTLVGVADRVAHDHPVWYERFRISSKFVRAWRWLKN